MRFSKLGPRNDALQSGSTAPYYAELRKMKRNRAPNAAARSFRTFSSQALLQPRVGRSAYERSKRSNFPSSIFIDRYDESSCRPPGRGTNQVAARRTGPTHAIAALSTQYSKPTSDCRNDYV